ncbi:MAG: tetratricopeptide repeat protein [Gemmatimonadota bacterium]|nr:MAG: tetratricopeptide repeat protein [Gemmatimonadota bacterium]
MAYQSEIEKLEQRYHENPQQWFAALADSYRKAGDLELALDVVRGGLEKRPNYASGHIVLGRCLFDQEKYRDAAAAFEQVLELDAENIIALKSLGEIAEKQHDLAGAKSWLTRLLDIDPMNEEAREGIERIGEAEQAAPPEAEPVAEEAAAASIEPGAAWAAEALASMDRGQKQEDSESARDEAAGEMPAEVVTVQPEVLEQPLSESEEVVGADQGFTVERTSWDDTHGAVALGRSDGSEASAGEESGAEADALGVPLTVEPVSGLEATAESGGPEEPAEPADSGLGEPSEISPGVESVAADGDGVRMAGDLKVVSFDEELSWDAGERQSTAITDSDIKEAEGHHADLAAPVAFLGDPEAYAARAGGEPAGPGEPVDSPVAPDSIPSAPAGVSGESAEAEQGRPVEPIGELGDSTVSGQPPEEKLGPGMADVPESEDEIRVGVSAESEQASGGWEPPSAEEQAEFERASAAAEPADLPLIMPDEAGAGPEPISVSPDEVEPVVTETMAEVYARQGLYDQARETYERLLQQRPGDRVLEEKLALLSQRQESQPGVTSSRFSVASTGGVSAVDYLRGIFQKATAPGGESVGQPPAESAAPEPTESTVLESAFGAEPEEPPGSPTIPATDDVSLSSVFGGEPVSRQPAPQGREERPLDQAGAVSFDEFYGTAPESEPEGGGAEEPEPTGEEGDEDFKNWLEGLKT